MIQNSEIDVSEWRDWQRSAVTELFVAGLKADKESLINAMVNGQYNSQTVEEEGKKSIELKAYLQAIQKVINFVEEKWEDKSV